MRAGASISALAIAVLCLVPGSADAYFTGAGAGSAPAAVESLSAPGDLAAVVSAGAVEITWSASSVAGGIAASGYTIERYGTGGESLGPATCSPVASAAGQPDPLGQFSCVDRPSPGVYAYAVTAHYGSWSTSSARTSDVELATSQTSLASSANPASVGERVVYTATVETAPAGFPGGAVRFLDGGVAIAGCSEVSLSAGDPHRAVCEVEYTHVGSDEVTAHYLGNGSYPASSSAALTEGVVKGDQSIRFPELPPKYLNESATVSATTSSGLPVSLVSQTPQTCLVSGEQVTLEATGTCSIQATQEGDEDWNAAEPVTRSFAIANPPAGPLVALEPAFVDSGSGPARVSVAPDGTSVYTTNRFGTSLSEYARNPESGALTRLSPATVTTGSEPEGVAVAPNGAFAYVADRASNAISQYARDSATGVLTPLEPATVAADFGPIGLAVSPNGENLYAVDSKSEQVGEYRVEADGQLVTLSSSMTEAGANAHGVVVSPDGEDLYVTNYNSGTVGMYRIGAGGVLTSLGVVEAGVNPHDLAISADGSDVYVADNVVPGVIVEFSRHPETGMLSPIGSIEAGAYPECLVVSAAGEDVYATNEISSSVSQYARNAETGLLRPLAPATVAAGVAPEGIAISPDGKDVYVANRESGTVSQYRR